MMKNLIGILTILLITAGVFGQQCGISLSEFASNPATIVKPTFNISQGYLDLNTYSFWEDGDLFILSYDPDEEFRDNNIIWGEGKKTRNIFLYRLDGDKWVKASNLVKTDSFDSDGNYDYYYPKRRDLNELIEGIGYSEIERLGDKGIIIMKVLSFYGNQDDKIYEHRWDGITFIPQGDKTYLAAKLTQ